MNLNIIFFYLNSFILIKCLEKVQINTELGPLLGVRKLVENKLINIFYGVPYAKPPLGHLRFKKSYLINYFQNKPYNATYLRPHCEQTFNSKYERNPFFSEDCLYMNIFVPSKLNNQNCDQLYPVMIYIYGGVSSNNQLARFQEDENQFSLLYKGDYYAALYSTILVTFNYRQQLFANLYIKDKLPGNLALFDQNLAIQFVKKYIGNFCGDQTKLTIFGNSFGSMSIGLHLLSDYSKNLIQNAIMLSGTPFTEAILKNRLNVIKYSLQIVHKLKCFTYQTSYLDNYLTKFNLTSSKLHIKLKLIEDNFFFNLNSNIKDLSQESETFVKKSIKFYYNQTQLNDIKFDTFLKQLNYEDEVDEENYYDYLTNYVDLNCIQNQSIDKLRKINEELGSKIFLFIDGDFVKYKTIFEFLIENELNFNLNTNLLIGNVANEMCLIDKTNEMLFKQEYDQLPKSIAKKIIEKLSRILIPNLDISYELAEYYTDDTKWSFQNGYIDSLYLLLNDYFYFCPTFLYANLALNSMQSVNAYIINEKSNIHFSDNLKHLNTTEICHADELFYVFGTCLEFPEIFNSSEIQMSKQILNILTHFAEYGKLPKLEFSKIKWPDANHLNKKLDYVQIDHLFIEPKNYSFQERCNNFWFSISPLYKLRLINLN